MSRKTVSALALVLTLVISGPANAQFIAFFECDVEDTATFASAIDRFYESMAGGARPTINLDAMIWNGENRATHRVVVNYPDYQAFESFRSRVGTSLGWLQFGNSARLSSDCLSEGAIVERGFWGDREAEIHYIAVYPSVVSDAAAYVEAFGELMESSLGQQAPGPVLLYENRAGAQGVSHYVVFVAETFTDLNGFLDQLQGSDEYSDFVDEVRDIRELQTANQAQRLRIWTP